MRRSKRWVHNQRSEKTRVVLSLAILRGVSAAIFAISIPFLNIYFFEEGYKMALVGGITGISAFLGSSMRIPSGFLADKYGALRILIAGILMRSVSLTTIGILIILKAHILFFAPFIFLNSVGFAFLVISTNTAIGYLFEDEKRPHVLSVVRVGINTGFAIGPIIGGFLSEYSYSLLFFISGFLSALMIFPALRLKSGKEKKAEKFITAGGTVENFSFKISTAFFFLIMTVFFTSSLVSQFISNFPVFAKSVGIENRKIGYFFTLNGIFVVLLQVHITKFAVFFGKRESALLGIIIYTVFLNLFGFGDGVLWYSFVVFGLTLGEMLFLPLLMSFAMETAPEGRKGTYLGFYEFSEAAGWSFGRFFGGAMFDVFGQSPHLFWASVSLTAPASIISLLMFYRKTERERIKEHEKVKGEFKEI